MNPQRPSAIRDELIRLTDQHGGTITPQQVVEAARDEASPLHKSFEWDDTAAAESWRKQQARQLLTVVVQYHEVGDDKFIRVPVFTSLTPDRKEGTVGYRLTSAVLQDDERRQQLLSDAKAEMRSFAKKYRTLTELADVFAAMNTLLDEEQPADVPAAAHV